MLGKTIKSTKSHYCHQNYAKSWSNNGLLMRNVVAANKCLAANNILRMRKRNHAFSPSCDRSRVKMADRFASLIIPAARPKRSGSRGPSEHVSRPFASDTSPK